MLATIASSTPDSETGVAPPSIGTLAKFLWAWLAPHLLVVPMLTWLIHLWIRRGAEQGLDGAMRLLTTYQQFAVIPLGVFLPVGIVFLAMLLIDWKSRLSAFSYGFAALLSANGLISLAVCFHQG
jgi:hypothetical protein